MLLYNAGSSLNHTQRSLALLLQNSFSVGGVLVFPLPYLISLLVQYQDTQSKLPPNIVSTTVFARMWGFKLSDIVQ